MAGAGAGVREVPEMIGYTILEGLGLSVLLVLVCAVGIRKGAVGMVHLYSPEVQVRCVQLGLTSHEKIRKNSLLFKAICVPGYLAYVLVCAYAVNGARGQRTCGRISPRRTRGKSGCSARWAWRSSRRCCRP